MNTDLHRWERRQLASGSDELTHGESLTLYAPCGGWVGVAVRLPGTLWRVYWPGGAMSDYARETDAIAAVERRAGIAIGAKP